MDAAITNLIAATIHMHLYT